MLRKVGQAGRFLPTLPRQVHELHPGIWASWAREVYCPCAGLWSRVWVPLLQKVVTENGSFDLNNLDQNSSTPLFPLWLLRLLPNMISAHISMMFNAQGPNSTVTTACVAGTQAVGEGFRMVSRGEADLVI